MKGETAALIAQVLCTFSKSGVGDFESEAPAGSTIYGVQSKSIQFYNCDIELIGGIIQSRETPARDKPIEEGNGVYKD